MRPDRQAGGALAHLLDRRPNGPGEPLAHLPATINPLEFLIANVLRNNAYLVRIKASSLRRRKLGLYNMRHLRRLLPPQIGVVRGDRNAVPSDGILADEQIGEAIRRSRCPGPCTTRSPGSP